MPTGSRTRDGSPRRVYRKPAPFALRYLRRTDHAWRPGALQRLL